MKKILLILCVLAVPIGLPIAVGILVSGNDTVKADFGKSYEAVYNASLAALKDLGKVKSEDKKKGLINGSVKSVTVKMRCVIFAA